MSLLPQAEIRDRKIFETGADAMLEALRHRASGMMATIPDDPQPEKECNATNYLTFSDASYLTAPRFPPGVCVGVFPEPKVESKTHPATQVIESGYFCPKCGFRNYDRYSQGKLYQLIRCKCEDGEEWESHRNRGISY
jgi:hypothetical protein